MSRVEGAMPVECPGHICCLCDKAWAHRGECEDVDDLNLPDADCRENAVIEIVEDAMTKTARECTHDEERGGVYRNNDPYGTLKKLGLPTTKFRHVCWACYEEWGRTDDEAERVYVNQVVAERGLCGFIEAWIGHCLSPKPCAKHGRQRCWKCKGPAVQNCAETGSLVCGVPECADHPHLHEGGL